MDRLGVIPTTSDSQLVETRLAATETSGNLREETDKRRFRIFFAIGLACALLVSELPYVLTLARTGWTPLPPVVDYPADQMLYLNFTAIQHSSAGEVVNPWYGERVPIADIPHLKFPITFKLFALLRLVLRSWTGTMLVWTGIWSLLTFAAAVFCLRSIAPELDERCALFFAFGLMVLLSPLTYISILMRLPSWHNLFDLTLPYMRFMFPQVALPAFLAYCGFLANALRAPRRTTLAWMALLQFYCCAAFPYIVPIIALATLVAVLIALFQRQERSLSLFGVLAFGIVCAVLDASYFFFAGLQHSRGNVKLALEFRPDLILASFRPFVGLLFAAAVLAALSRISFAGRAVAVSVAVAGGVFSFVDVFFPKESQMLTHFNYINALPTWLAIFAFAWPFLSRRFRPIAPVITAILIVISSWEVYASYAPSLAGNQFRRAAIYELQGLGLTSTDAVLAPDDISSISPLVTPARAVYASAAQGMLPPDMIQGEHSLRQAFYLSTRGYSRESLSSLTASESSRRLPGEVTSYADVHYLESSAAADRARGRSLVRERLLPALTRLESDHEIGRVLFFAAKRVVVIDDDSKPNFVRSVIANWIDISQETHRNGVRIIAGKPKTPPASELTHGIGIPPGLLKRTRS